MMKTNIATDPSQSARLQACGVDPNTADMVWQEPITTSQKRTGGKILVFRNPNHQDYVGDVPAWSLSALMELLPSSLTSALGNKYHLELSKLRMHNAWEVQWFNGREGWRTINKDKKFHKLWDKSPIEVCVKAIEWLSQNRYKLNEIKQ